jgi:hypothetical protein
MVGIEGPFTRCVAESFQLVSGTDPKVIGESSLRHGSLKEDNDELKRQLRQAQSRIADLEKLMKERMAHEHQLRDSIMQVCMIFGMAFLSEVATGTTRN